MLCLIGSVTFSGKFKWPYGKRLLEDVSKNETWLQSKLNNQNVRLVGILSVDAGPLPCINLSRS